MHLLECLRLRIRNIDFDQHMIPVGDTKSGDGAGGATGTYGTGSSRAGQGAIECPGISERAATRSARYNRVRLCNRRPSRGRRRCF
jgi:hypothetical protein